MTSDDGAAGVRARYSVSASRTRPPSDIRRARAACAARRRSSAGSRSCVLCMCMWLHHERALSQGPTGPSATGTRSAARLDGDRIPSVGIADARPTDEIPRRPAPRRAGARRAGSRRPRGPRHLQVENSAFRVRDGPLRWTIHTDHRGFRSPAVPVERTGLRILTLGDSCTFGFRVNDADTYPARLMRACAAHAPGGRVHVLDAGVPGYTSYQGRRLLPALLATYQ